VPQDQLPKLELENNSPKSSSDKWREILDNVLNHVFEENRQTKDEETARSKLLKQIKKIVSRKYPQTKLHLFGSSNNGFAMKNSDLDICMTLDKQSAGDVSINHEQKNALTYS
jgi:DNA polymerase sigma